MSLGEHSNRNKTNFTLKEILRVMMKIVSGMKLGQPTQRHYASCPVGFAGLSVQYNILSALFRFRCVFNPTASGSCRRPHRAQRPGDGTLMVMESSAR